MELYPFQVEGVKWLGQRSKALLADEMGCVEGDAVVHLNRVGIGKKITLRRLYEGFVGTRWDRSLPVRCRALCGDELRQHEIRDVLFKGERAVLQLTLESGKSLKLTPDHRVARPNGRWTPVKELEPGDVVLTNGQAVCLLCGSSKNVSTYPRAKFVGYCKKCIYWKLRKKSTWKGGKFVDQDGYVRVAGQINHPRRGTQLYVYEHILVMENHLGRRIVWPEVIHHKNGNRADNRVENLELVSMSTHHRIHRKHLNLHGGVTGKGGAILCFPREEKVVSVEPAGKVDVYDIVMAPPYHNFVANGIVVHNCGKTLQGVAWGLKAPGPRLVICPAAVKYVWEREIRRMTSERYLIIAGKERVPNNPPPWVIINYDLLKREVEAIRAIPWSTLILDESHYIKNQRAQRTKLVLKIGKSIYRVLLISGSPVLNRPVELFPQLVVLGKWRSDRFFSYATDFCDAKQKYISRRVGYVWDFSGASNTDQLREFLTPFMLRRLKRDVLTDLPPIVRATEIVDLSWDVQRQYEAAEAAFAAWMVSQGGSGGLALTKLNTLRQLAVAGKVEIIAERLALLREEGRKAVVFCGFLDKGLDLIEQQLRPGEYVRLTGDESPMVRAENNRRFQTDPTCLFVLGSVMAAGVGIDLTAADLVLFADLPWSPMIKRQAEDRLHRIGQQNSVQVIDLLGRGTVDEAMWEVLQKKTQIINEVITGKEVFDEAAFVREVGQEIVNKRKDVKVSPK